MGASPKEVRVHELLLREAKAQEQLAIAEAIAEEQAVQLSACLKHVADFTEATDRQLVQQAAAATIQGHWHRRRGRQNVISVMEALKSGRVSAVEERMPQPAAAPIQRETEALQSELLALRAETDDEIARLQVAHRRERERLQQQLKDAEETTQPAGESSDGLATQAEELTRLKSEHQAELDELVQVLDGERAKVQRMERDAMDFKEKYDSYVASHAEELQREQAASADEIRRVTAEQQQRAAQEVESLRQEHAAALISMAQPEQDGVSDQAERLARELAEERAKTQRLEEAQRMLEAAHSQEIERLEKEHGTKDCENPLRSQPAPRPFGAPGGGVPGQWSHAVD